MFTIALISLVLIACTTLVHYEVLRELNGRLPRLGIPNRFKLLVVVFSTLFAHMVEIGLYGGVLCLLPHSAEWGSLVGPGGSDLVSCLYFSAETYTSLGFGDITPSGPVRLLAGAEALNGLLLIGWSASYLHIAMERFWNGAAEERG
ncbi:MAG: potassium channel family protein [Burkholderiaceae bacterium]|nr:potassium channel family protein [Burkholderiaceae bacterium]